MISNLCMHASYGDDIVIESLQLSEPLTDIQLNELVDLFVRVFNQVPQLLVTLYNEDNS